MSASPDAGMSPKPRKRDVWFWLKRVALGLLAVILLLAIAGFAYQTIATARDARDYPPPGKVIAVNGHAMHMICTGEPRPDTATVILEAGTGLASPAWALVVPQIAPKTRVCAYDRAGNGWSAPGPLPRDPAAVASDLHALLAAANIAPPYVLAGHSFGGIYSRAYADAYPGEVTGLVLIDSSHPDQLTRSPSRAAAIATYESILRVAPLLARIGIVRLAGLGDSEVLDIPERQQHEMTAFGALPTQAETMLAELTQFPAAAEQLHQAANLGAKPLFVVSAGKDTDPDWATLQDELAGLSTNSVHHTIATANHTELLFTTAGADVTAAAILTVVEAARTGAPLAP